jgi:hypothetical protein
MTSKFHKIHRQSKFKSSKDKKLVPYTGMGLIRAVSSRSPRATVFFSGRDCTPSGPMSADRVATPRSVDHGPVQCLVHLQRPRISAFFCGSNFTTRFGFHGVFLHRFHQLLQVGAQPPAPTFNAPTFNLSDVTLTLHGRTSWNPTKRSTLIVQPFDQPFQQPHPCTDPLSPRLLHSLLSGTSFASTKDQDCDGCHRSRTREYETLRM